VALDLAHRHAPGVQGQDLVVIARPARLVLGHDLRLKAGMSVTGDINGQLAKVAFEGLFAFAVTGIASGISHAGILGVPQVLGHLRFQSALDEALGQLLEQAVLADEVFRFFIASQ
jgi:hypothetical protein